MQGSIDVGGPFRNALLAMAARRLKSRSHRPESVKRSYWTVGEYQKDAARLKLLGYEVSSETITNPYIEGASFRQRPAMQVRVPMAHVLYELAKGRY
jgi:hypothetical protein